MLNREVAVGGFVGGKFFFRYEKSVQEFSIVFSEVELVDNPLRFLEAPCRHVWFFLLDFIGKKLVFRVS